MNKIFVNNIGDLSEAQRASFYRFLANGISEELINFPNPFSSKIRILGGKKIPCLVYLYINDLKLKGPNYSLDICLKRDMTYSIQMFIPCEYSYSIETNSELSSLNDKSNKKGKINKIRIKQDIFFGEIPLITEEGTFLINGCERIVISQIIRSPGIYFRKEFGVIRKTIYTATIISNKGLWTKFVLDQSDPDFVSKESLKRNPVVSKDRIYIKLNEFKSRNSNEISEKDDSDSNKLFIYDLIRYFGLSIEEILDSLKYSLHL